MTPRPLVEVEMEHYQGRIFELGLRQHEGRKRVKDYHTLVNPGLTVPDPLVNEAVVAKPRFEDIAKALAPVFRGALVQGTLSDILVLANEFRRVGVDVA